MIIQSADSGKPHFVIEQTDHAATSGQAAAVFGNQQFKSLDPADLIVYITTHHDEGWKPIDDRVEQSPETGLPYNLTQTPLPYLLETSIGSPNFNEAYHPFCGLLSSMHTYGLFNGRYGLSDFIFIDKVPEEHKADMLAMLDAELERQARLKANLPAELASEEALFHNYKLLQFFDTLALYFQTTHAGAREAGEFQNVPDGRGNDIVLNIFPLDDGSYRLSPWPFAEATIELVTLGRELEPQSQGTDLEDLFRNTPKVEQVYRLVST